MRKRRALRDLMEFQKAHPQVSIAGLEELSDDADIAEIRETIEKALTDAQDYLQDSCKRFTHKLYGGGK